MIVDKVEDTIGYDDGYRMMVVVVLDDDEVSRVSLASWILCGWV